MEEHQISIHHIQQPFGEEIQSELMKFFFSLKNEQDAFSLTFEQIQSASQLFYICKNKEIFGIAGIRRIFFINIYFMVVKEEEQGKGYGKKLMTKVLKELSGKLIILSVNRANIKARRLYNTLHFDTIFREKYIAYMLYMNTKGKVFKLPAICMLYLKSLLP